MSSDGVKRVIQPVDRSPCPPLPHFITIIHLTIIWFALKEMTLHLVPVPPPWPPVFSFTFIILGQLPINNVMFDHSWVFSCYQKGSGLGEKRNRVQKKRKKQKQTCLHWLFSVTIRAHKDVVCCAQTQSSNLSKCHKLDRRKQQAASCSNEPEWNTFLGASLSSLQEASWFILQLRGN